MKTPENITKGIVKADERRITLRFPDGETKEYRLGGTENKQEAVSWAEHHYPQSQILRVRVAYVVDGQTTWKWIEE